MFFLVLCITAAAVAADFQSGLKDYNRGDYRSDFDVFSTYAAQGDVVAQYNLGILYANGEGVAQDYEKAVYWYKKAAAQGYVSAQYNLGLMYAYGKGVAQDYVSALKWFILAAVCGDQKSIKYRDILSKNLTPSQVAEAQRMARNFSPHVVSPTSSPTSTQASFREPLVVARPLVRKIQQHLVFLGYNPGPVDGLSGSRTTAAIKAFQRDWEITPDGIISESLLALLKIAKTVKENNASTKQAPQQAAVSGTAFLVSSQYAVTNYHVVKGAHHLVLCIGDNRVEVSLIAHDSTNDLAVIKLSAPLSKDQEFARFRDSGIIHLGEQVMIAGYPLRGYLSSGLNVSRGEVSALSGPANDCRLIQISAPVQPGNSGGPLLDKSGLVIGIVVAKLNAIKCAKVTGDIPQNINFAVKGALIKSFLDVNGIYYVKEKTHKLIDSQTKASQAAQYTFPLECYQ